jgi:organic hydroperoxide reductase OsmC/OhrA
MIGLIPEQMFASAFQLACFCMATLTVLVSFLFVPRG